MPTPSLREKISVLVLCEISEETSRDIPPRKRKNIPVSINIPRRMGCLCRKVLMAFNQQPAESEMQLLFTD
jgi:hypothetical protein